MNEKPIKKVKEKPLSKADVMESEWAKNYGFVNTIAIMQATEWLKNEIAIQYAADNLTPRVLFLLIDKAFGAVKL